MAPARFTLSAASSLAKKREIEITPPAAAVQPAAKKPAVAHPPRASQVAMEKGPKPASAPQRLPPVAPVILTVYKVSDEAGDVWAQFEGHKVFQIQVKHDARPSVTFDTYKSFGDFLTAANEKDTSVPATLKSLQEAGIRMILSGEGFVPWRVAFYVAGDVNAVKNCLALLNEFFEHQQGNMARELPFEVEVYPHISVPKLKLDLGENFTIHEPAAKKLPMGIFDAQPVNGSKLLTLHIEPMTATALNILISGPTFQYKKRLAAHGMSSADQTEGSTKAYYSVMKDIDVTENKACVVELVTTVLNSLAIRVMVDPVAQPGSDVAAFIEELRKLRTLHFV